MAALITRYVTYPEDGLWVAHSLEMDIIGVGETPKAAVQELKSNSEAHLSFARFKQISPLRPAPANIQNLWKKLNLAALGLTETSARASKAPKTKALSPSADIMQWSEKKLSKLPDFDLQCA